MYTLTKHKKLGVRGFKTFVKNLELFPENTVSTMVSVAMLEDPVYMKWALKNKIRFDQFLNLDYESVLKVLDKLKPSSIKLLVFAINGHPEELTFLKNNIEGKNAFEYNDFAEYTTVSPKQLNIGRTRIMEALFELEMSNEIPAFLWDLPPDDILKGESHKLSIDGSYTQSYVSGKIALEGKLANMLREGVWKHHYPNGAIFAEGIYLQGEKSGDWIFFYPNGNKKSIGLYKNDLKHGEWTEFDKNGGALVLKYKEGQIL
ncbi:MAG: hypothetical protein HN576_05625 [Bacteriovoracaceae bacterium]|jgi:hypothetical protein|nr:hypothetical protein [Bacteriovoracaceae bacterium]